PPASRLISHAPLALAFALIAAGLPAATHTFHTGDPMPTLAAGDTVRISGSAGLIALPGAGIGGAPTSLTVNEWAVTPLSFNFAVNDVTFEQEDKVADSWAVIDNAGWSSDTTNIRPLRLTAVAASNNRILTLDHLIVTGGNSTTRGGGAYVAGNATTFLRINGDAVFHANTIRASNGSGVGTDGASLTFGGTVIFSANTAGLYPVSGTWAAATAANGNGAGLGSTAGAVTSKIIFEKPVFFLSNTAGGGGGAIFLNAGHSLTFESDATFAGNRGRLRSGGAIYLDAAAGTAGTLLFKGNTLFSENISGTSTHGGAIYTPDQASVIFDGGPGATYRFEKNVASANGGAIASGTIKILSGTFIATSNLNTNHHDTNSTGGAIRATGLLEINTPFLFDSNMIGGGGGGSGWGAAIYGTGDIRINATGTFTGNIATSAGAAIYHNKAGGAVTITAATGGIAFLDNITQGTGGGAIQFAQNSAFSLAATGGDILFEGNRRQAVINRDAVLATGGTAWAALTVTSTGNAQAVYFAASTTSTLNLEAAENRAIRFHDPIGAGAGAILNVYKTGAGAVIFDTHESAVPNANVSVYEGSFQLSNDAVFGSSTTQGSVLVKNGAALAGAGTIRTGTLTLETGALLKAAGGNLRIEADVRNFAAGFVLAGSGTITTGAPSLGVTNITPGDGTAAQDLTLADSVTLDDSAVINLYLYDGDAGDGYDLSDRVNFSGTFAGAGHTINLKSLQSGTFNLGSIGDFLPHLAVTLNGSSDLGGRQTAVLSATNGSLILYAGADYSRVLTWTGASGARWDISAQSWTDFDSVSLYAGGDRVVFSGTADTPAARSVEIQGGGVNVSDMWIRGAENYAFTGSGGIAARSSFEVKIGGSSAVANAAGRLVMAGSGTLSFENTGANVFAGGIDIHGGVLVFNNAAQLGTEGAPITFRQGGGGVLKSAVNAATALAGTFVVEADTVGIIDTGAYDMTLSGTLAGPGALQKNGAGTLVLAGGGKTIAEIRVSAGTLQGDTTSLTSRIANDTGVVLAQASAGLFTGTITGAGEVRKTGAGVVTFADAAITAGAFTLAQGGAILAEGAPVRADTFVVAQGATLSATGAGITVQPRLAALAFTNHGTLKIGRAAGADTYGALTIAGDYTAGAGSAVELTIGRNYAVPGTGVADRLVITGTLAGALDVNFHQTSLLAANTDFATLVPVAAGAFAADVAITSNPVSLDDGTAAWLRYDPATGIGWETYVAPEVPALLGVDAASLLVGRAALDALGARLQSSRAGAIAGARGFSLWLNGFHAADKLTAARALYEGAHHTATGAAAGAEWTYSTAAGTATHGFFVDFATSDLDQDTARVKTGTASESRGFGAYLSHRPGRWYFNALLRLSNDDYDINVPGKPRFSTSGDGWAGSFESGVTFLDAGGFLNWEPQLQITYQTRDTDGATDAAGFAYDIARAASVEGRFGVRLWHDYKIGSALLRPFLRASFAYEFDGATEVKVAGSDAVYKNTLRGRREIFDLGADLRLGRHFGAGASASIYTGESTQGAAFDLNISYLW
ncbi:autotransporter outer membrane beta-barrel domain-containing protein, partial [Termitidicoccus mucosus]